MSKPPQHHDHGLQETEQNNHSLQILTQEVEQLHNNRPTSIIETSLKEESDTPDNEQISIVKPVEKEALPVSNNIPLQTEDISQKEAPPLSNNTQTAVEQFDTLEQLQSNNAQALPTEESQNHATKLSIIKNLLGESISVVTLDHQNNINSYFSVEADGYLQIITGACSLIILLNENPDDLKKAAFAISISTLPEGLFTLRNIDGTLKISFFTQGELDTILNKEASNR